MSQFTFTEQVADAPNPAAGQRTLFAKMDGMYQRPDIGPAVKFVSTDASNHFSVDNIPPNPFDDGTYALFVDYHSSGSPAAADEVQYTRVWLSEGITIATMRTHIRGGANGVRQLRMAIYDQAVPASNSGVPNNQVATTLVDTPPGAFTGERNIALTASYLVTVSGWYWLALQVDSGALSFLVSPSFPAGSIARREENPGSFTLPATAGATTQPASAVMFVAAVE